jgi:hypothetical protein
VRINYISLFPLKILLKEEKTKIKKNEKKEENERNEENEEK